LTRDPRCEAGTLVRAATADGLAAAAPPPLVEVTACGEAPCDTLGWADCREVAARWLDLRRCRAWRLAALPRRAMTPLWCVFALHA